MVNSTHPQEKTLWLLCLCGLVERFAHFGLMTILVLSLKEKFHLTDAAAFSLFGLFMSFSYGTLLFGGAIADRWLGLRKALLVGGLLVMAGNFALSTNHQIIFYFGLSTIVIGLALFNVNCVSLVGGLYKEDNQLRQRAYTLYYTCANIGSIISPIIFGYLSKHGSWSWCFYLNTILLITILFFLQKNNALKEFTSKNSSKNLLIYGTLPIICLLGTFLFSEANVGQVVLMCLFAANGAFFLRVLLKEDKTNRNKIFGILLLNLFTVFLFSCTFQVLSSITLFVERNIHREFFGFVIPTTVFSSLQPFFLVMMAPVFVVLWRWLARAGYTCTLSTKILTGILCSALAFIILYFAANASVSSLTLLPLLLLVFANFLLGSGEICMIPPIFAAISEYSPEKLKSTLMGSLYFFVSIAGFLAGQLSKLTDVDSLQSKVVDKTVSANIYSHGFLIVFFITCGFALVVFLCRKRVLHLLKGDGTVE